MATELISILGLHFSFPDNMVGTQVVRELPGEEAPWSLPDSVTTAVPDSLPPGAFICGRCHLVHEDREAWNRAHSLLWPCARCGLVHLDYWMSSTIRSIDEFDCAAALDVKREREEGGVEWRKV